jgi:outer membrane protein assembly factor BamB
MPVVDGDAFYWVTDAGLAVAADAKTGTVHWSERIFAKGVTACPLLAGDTVIAFAEDGKVVAFKAAKSGCEKVFESSLGEAIMASPAAADGRLFVRGATHLYCFGK